MGLYATTTSISVKLPNFLIGDTTTSDSIGTATFSAYIDKAEAMFNGCAAMRYDLPFATVPPLARELSFEMAAWYTIRAFGSRDWPNRNEMLDDFQRAFDDLERLKDGSLRLTLTDGSLIEPRTTLLQSNRTGQQSIFEVDNPMNWKVDEDRKDDIELGRD